MGWYRSTPRDQRRYFAAVLSLSPSSSRNLAVIRVATRSYKPRFYRRKIINYFVVDGDYRNSLSSGLSALSYIYVSNFPFIHRTGRKRRYTVRERNHVFIASHNYCGHFYEAEKILGRLIKSVYDAQQLFALGERR